VISEKSADINVDQVDCYDNFVFFHVSPFPAAVAAPEFSRGFQPTGRLANIPASRQRRLNTLRHQGWIQSSLTRRGKKNHAHRGLKPTAKFRRRCGGGGHPKISPKVLGSEMQSPICERRGLGAAFTLEYYKNV